MAYKSYGSSSWDKDGTLTLVGNNYRGLHQWGAYGKLAHEGMVFVSRKTDAKPYIFRARHEGRYGPFPAEGADNADWKSVGTGYPIINDLFFRNQRLYTWEERGRPYVKVGDYLVSQNPKDGDTEYYKMLRKPAGVFPDNKSSNAGWAYVGRYPKQGETLTPDLPVHHWSYENRSGKKG